MSDKPIDKKLISQILHQAFGGGSQQGYIDIYAEAWCLRDVEVADYLVLLKHMEDNGLVSESGEGEYHKITRKGESVSCGEDY